MFEDLWAYEICLPGAITGQGEIDCPHCGRVLNVPIDDPNGTQSYGCPRCSGTFQIDWARS